jgi:hypothetical protein
MKWAGHIAYVGKMINILKSFVRHPEAKTISRHWKNSVAVVRKRTIPTERPPLVGEVSANILLVEGVAWSAQRIPTAVDHGFLDRSRYFFIQVAAQLTSRGWVDPVPDPLLLRKSGRAGNRILDLWICSQKLWPLDHRGGLFLGTRGRIMLKRILKKKGIWVWARFIWLSMGGGSMMECFEHDNEPQSFRKGKEFVGGRAAVSSWRESVVHNGVQRIHWWSAAGSFSNKAVCRILKSFHWLTYLEWVL